MTKIDLNAAGPSKAELSRREREEIEKQRSQANYQKLHAEGKTDQARADLARLAIIKQHRAEAAARREAEKKGKLSNLSNCQYRKLYEHFNFLFCFRYIYFFIEKEDRTKKSGSKS